MRLIQEFVCSAKAVAEASTAMAADGANKTEVLKMWGFGREGSWPDWICQMPATRMLVQRMKQDSWSVAQISFGI